MLQYTKENNLEVYDFYIDDGYSGTNFDRPAFQRLLADIEMQKINMVITKDMSRLGRDYIKTGELLEKYFPLKNVRYISVTDNIDTYLDNTNNDIAPFKAIMNDFYAKDISKKIRSSLKAKMKEGKFVGCRPPFGYQKDEKNKNHLVVNHSQALIVKRIYKLALAGLTPFKIATILTNERIKTPSSYYNFNFRNQQITSEFSWPVKTIKDILTNQMYIGDLVQNKRNKINYKVKKIIKNDPCNYIIVQNTHEAIIDKSTFWQVQALLPKNITRYKKKTNYLLDGLLYCGDCLHRISITPRRKKDQRAYTICNFYRTSFSKKLCTTHSNNYDELEKTILQHLEKIIAPLVNKKEIKEKVNLYLNDFLSKSSLKEMKNIKLEISKLSQNLDQIYLDKINNLISLEQYERLSKKIENDLKIKKGQLKTLQSVNAFTTKSLELYLDDYLNFKLIERNLLLNLIAKILIYNDKRIEIIVNFQNI